MVGTPGRILALVRNKKLNLKHLKHFILDECDKMLELLGASNNLNFTQNYYILYCWKESLHDDVQIES